MALSSDEHTKQDAQYWLGLCYYYAPDWEGGDKEIAISELQKFIQKWSDSPLAPNAMYMIGRIYFGDVFSSRGRILYSKDAVRFDKSIETFENLIKRYPPSDLVDAAYYMQVLVRYLKGEIPSENEIGKATLALLEGIEDNERELRWLALEILTDFGEDGAMALIELFESRDDKAFKTMAALKLAEMGEASKKEEIFKIATEKENDINIRAVAAIALAKLQDKRATPLLVNYCKNSKILLAEEFRYNYLFSEPHRNFYHYYGRISIFGELQRSEIASSAVEIRYPEIRIAFSHITKVSTLESDIRILRFTHYVLRIISYSSIIIMGNVKPNLVIVISYRAWKPQVSSILQYRQHYRIR